MAALRRRLGRLGRALLLQLFFRLVAVAGPSRASVITYVNPLVAVVLGVLVLGEALGTASIAGLALILVGSWLATGGGSGSTPDGRVGC